MKQLTLSGKNLKDFGFIALDEKHLQLVENIEICHLVEHMEQRYRLPSSKYFLTLLCLNSAREEANTYQQS